MYPMYFYGNNWQTDNNTLFATSFCCFLILTSILMMCSFSGMAATPLVQREIQVDIQPPQSDEPYKALAHSNEEWYGSTFWTGSDWTRVGRNWHHPGDMTPSVRCFVAPKSCRVTVSGRVYKADTNNGGGDGILAYVRYGGQEVWRAEIDGNDTQGVEHNIQMDVVQGSEFRFVVHNRGAFTL